MEYNKDLQYALRGYDRVSEGVEGKLTEETFRNRYRRSTLLTKTRQRARDEVDYSPAL